jgi:LacI family transcriptional regulator
MCSRSRWGLPPTNANHAKGAMDENMPEFSSMAPDSSPQAGDSAPAPHRREDFSRRGTGLPTMAAVAKLAGVSLKTVSRVVNGEAGVRPTTEAQVRAAWKSLGYRRNDAASALAKAQTQAGIGLLIEDISDPFYSRLTRGVQEVARDYGHFVMLSSSEENTELERTTVLALAARGAAGLIVVPHSDDQHYLEPEIESGLAVVFVDRPPQGLAADTVMSDNIEGSRLAVKHLLDLGHRRIGFIGNDVSIYTSTQRLRGYRKAHTAAGLTADEANLVVLGPRTEAEAGAATAALLSSEHPPTALFTQNNLLTMGAWRAIRESTASVELVGFDDFELADVLEPAVTVVAQDPAQLGRRAAELLFARLADGTAPIRRVIIPTKLIVRGKNP